MADVERTALGLSVGATNLAAVTAARAVTRKPVLTLYRQRPPEVGVPSENPKLNEPWLVITDFVERVGDPAGIAAGTNDKGTSQFSVRPASTASAHAIGGRMMTFAVSVASAMADYRISLLLELSIDHFIGGDQEPVGNGDAEGFGGLQIEHEFDLGSDQHRQIFGPVTLQDAPGLNAGLAVAVGNVRPVAHQAAGNG